MLSAVTLWLALSAGVPEEGALMFAQGPQEPVASTVATSAERAPAVQRAAPAPTGGRKSESPNSPVPEPTTLLLVGTGLVGLAVSSRRWRRALSSGNAH